MKTISIFWFRRDLRLNDNAGLYHALRHGCPVLPLFIFDTNILDELDDKRDARVTFIYDTITELSQELEKLGSTLIVKNGKPFDVWKEIISEYKIDSVYCNGDYETYAINRDK